MRALKIGCLGFGHFHFCPCNVDLSLVLSLTGRSWRLNESGLVKHPAQYKVRKTDSTNPGLLPCVAYANVHALYQKPSCGTSKTSLWSCLWELFNAETSAMSEWEPRVPLNPIWGISTRTPESWWVTRGSLLRKRQDLGIMKSVTSIHKNSCGEHSKTYTETESLSWTPETKVLWCVNYTWIKKLKQNKNSRSHSLVIHKTTSGFLVIISGERHLPFFG